MGYTRPGKRLHNELERSTMFSGKIHCFDWAIFNSYVKLPEGKHYAKPAPIEFS